MTNDDGPTMVKSLHVAMKRAYGDGKCEQQMQKNNSAAKLLSNENVKQ